jgi:hypothetical protein
MEEEWIENKGGRCPVPSDTRVDVKFGDGAIFRDKPARYWLWMRYSKKEESERGTAECVITHYRIREQS